MSDDKTIRLKYEDVPRRIAIRGGEGYTCNWKDIEMFLDGTYRTLTSLHKKLPDIHPDFQRGHVWSLDQQRDYVEYVIEGGFGATQLLWNQSEDMVLPAVLVDGLQRLTAVRKFMGDGLRVFHGLRGRAVGYVASDFTPGILGRLAFQMAVNDLPTRADVLRWYLEINAGGTPHADAEIDRVREMYVAEGGDQALTKVTHRRGSSKRRLCS